MRSGEVGVEIVCFFGGGGDWDGAFLSKVVAPWKWREVAFRAPGTGRFDEC